MSSKNHLVVIDPGTTSAETICFNGVAARWTEGRVSYHLPVFAGLDSLFRLPQETVAGIVLFGSCASVHDALPWQKPLFNWIWDRVSNDKIPLLAICYGHQLMAQSLGGEVGFWKGGEQFIGLRKVTVTRPFLGLLPGTEGMISQAHGEYVVKVPEEMEVVLRSEDGGVEGMRHKSLPIYTVQGHPEADEHFLVSQGAAAPKDFPPFGARVVEQFLDSIRR